MKTLKELIEKRDSLIAEMEAAVEDEVRFKEIETEISELEKEIRQAKIEAAKNSPEMPEIPEEPEGREEDKKEVEYRSAFEAYLRKEDLSVDEKRALAEGTDSAGGYTVPVEMGKKIIEKKKTLRAIRKYVDAFASSTERDIPVEGTAPTAEYIAENGAYPESDPTFGNVNLKAYKQGFIVRVPEELLSDTAFDLQEYLEKKAADAIAVLEEDKFINGTGSTMPTGILAGADSVDAAGTTIAFADLEKLVYSELKNVYHEKAVMGMNQKTFAAVKNLRAKDTDEKCMKWDEAKKCWVFDNKYPVLISDKMPDVPTAADSNDYPVIFGDLSYYKVADRLGFSIKVLNERYADNGQVGFRFTARNDGKLAVGEAVKKLKVTIPAE